jgi:ferredoxin
MKTTRLMRVIMIAGLTFVLVAGVYAVLEARAASTPGEAVAEISGCEGCPLAGTDQCSAFAAAEAADKPYVDAAKCIGCNKCVRVAPDAFAMDAKTGKAYVKPGASAASVTRGEKACPVDAVKQ